MQIENLQSEFQSIQMNQRLFWKEDEKPKSNRTKKTKLDMNSIGLHIYIAEFAISVSLDCKSPPQLRKDYFFFFRSSLSLSLLLNTVEMISFRMLLL